MTGVKVVDASALAALVFAEPEADAIAGRLEGAKLTAPSILDYELANVCLVKIRRDPSRREALRAAYEAAHRLRIEMVAVDHGGVLALAEETNLTAYDASYLWVALALRAELVTLDRKLAAAVS